MKPVESVAAFEQFVEDDGGSLVDISPRNGIARLLDFYSRIPAEGCDKPSEDMLLFQWGTYDWGEGEFFELNTTRQFIEIGEEDEPEISQMQLAFRFVPTPELRVLGEGNRWCSVRKELAQFQSFILESAAFLAVADQEAPDIRLSHSYV